MKTNYGPFGAEYLVAAPALAGGLEDFLGGERKSLIDRLDKLDNLLKQRIQIFYDNVDRLVQNSLSVSAKIQHVQNTEPYNTKRIDFLNRLSSDLDKQIGLEHTSGFKDQWLIQRELLNAVADYDRFKRMGDLK